MRTALSYGQFYCIVEVAISTCLETDEDCKSQVNCDREGASILIAWLIIESGTRCGGAPEMGLCFSLVRR